MSKGNTVARRHAGVLSRRWMVHRFSDPWRDAGDDESAPRVSLIEQARWAVRGGLANDEALAAITIEPARILGIDHRVGSVEVGKDADLVLYDEDPFSYRTQVVAVLVDSLATKMLVNFFVRVNKPPTPSRLFTDDAKAIEWLKDFSKERTDNNYE